MPDASLQCQWGCGSRGCISLVKCRIDQTYSIYSNFDIIHPTTHQNIWQSCKNGRNALRYLICYQLPQRNYKGGVGDNRAIHQLVCWTFMSKLFSDANITSIDFEYKSIQKIESPTIVFSFCFVVVLLGVNTTDMSLRETALFHSRQAALHLTLHLTLS